MESHYPLALHMGNVQTAVDDLIGGYEHLVHSLPELAEKIVSMQNGTEGMANELKDRIKSVAEGYEYLNAVSSQVPESLREFATTHKQSLIDASRILDVKERENLDSQSKQLDIYRNILKSLAHERVVSEVLTRETLSQTKNYKPRKITRPGFAKATPPADEFISIPQFKPALQSDKDKGALNDKRGPQPTRGRPSVAAAGGGIMVPSMRQGSIHPDARKIKTSPQHQPLIHPSHEGIARGRPIKSVKGRAVKELEKKYNKAAEDIAHVQRQLNQATARLECATAATANDVKSIAAKVDENAINQAIHQVVEKMVDERVGAHSQSKPQPRPEMAQYRVMTVRAHNQSLPSTPSSNQSSNSHTNGGSNTWSPANNGGSRRNVSFVNAASSTSGAPNSLQEKVGAHVENDERSREGTADPHNERLVLATITSADAKAGDQRVHLESYQGVKAGLVAIIGDDDGFFCDRCTIAAAGSIVLAHPLAHDHSRGTKVRIVDPSGPSTSTSSSSSRTHVLDERDALHFNSAALSVAATAPDGVFGLPQAYQLVGDATGISWKLCTTAAADASRAAFGSVGAPEAAAPHMGGPVSEYTHDSAFSIGGVIPSGADGQTSSIWPLIGGAMGAQGGMIVIPSEEERSGDGVPGDAVGEGRHGLRDETERGNGMQIRKFDPFGFGYPMPINRTEPQPMAVRLTQDGGRGAESSLRVNPAAGDEDTNSVQVMAGGGGAAPSEVFPPSGGVFPPRKTAFTSRVAVVPESAPMSSASKENESTPALAPVPTPAPVGVERELVQLLHEVVVKQQETLQGNQALLLAWIQQQGGGGGGAVSEKASLPPAEGQYDVAEHDHQGGEDHDDRRHVDHESNEGVTPEMGTGEGGESGGKAAGAGASSAMAAAPNPGPEFPNHGNNDGLAETRPTAGSWATAAKRDTTTTSSPSPSSVSAGAGGGGGGDGKGSAGGGGDRLTVRREHEGGRGRRVASSALLTRMAEVAEVVAFTQPSKYGEDPAAITQHPSGPSAAEIATSLVTAINTLSDQTRERVDGARDRGGAGSCDQAQIASDVAVAVRRGVVEGVKEALTLMDARSVRAARIGGVGSNIGSDGLGSDRQRRSFGDEGDSKGAGTAHSCREVTGAPVTRDGREGVHEGENGRARVGLLHVRGMGGGRILSRPQRVTSIEDVMARDILDSKNQAAGLRVRGPADGLRSRGGVDDDDDLSAAVASVDSADLDFALNLDPTHARAQREKRRAEMSRRDDSRSRGRGYGSTGDGALLADALAGNVTRRMREGPGAGEGKGRREGVSGKHDSDDEEHWHDGYDDDSSEDAAVDAVGAGGAGGGVVRWTGRGGQGATPTRYQGLSGHLRRQERALYKRPCPLVSHIAHNDATRAVMSMGDSSLLGSDVSDLDAASWSSQSPLHGELTGWSDRKWSEHSHPDPIEKWSGMGASSDVMKRAGAGAGYIGPNFTRRADNLVGSAAPRGQTREEEGEKLGLSRDDSADVDWSSVGGSMDFDSSLTQDSEQIRSAVRDRLRAAPGPGGTSVSTSSDSGKIIGRSVGRFTKRNVHMRSSGASTRYDDSYGDEDDEDEDGVDDDFRSDSKSRGAKGKEKGKGKPRALSDDDDDVDLTVDGHDDDNDDDNDDEDILKLLQGGPLGTGNAGDQFDPARGVARPRLRLWRPSPSGGIGGTWIQHAVPSREEAETDVAP